MGDGMCGLGLAQQKGSPRAESPEPGGDPGWYALPQDKMLRWLWSWSLQTPTRTSSTFRTNTEGCHSGLGNVPQVCVWNLRM